MKTAGKIPKTKNVYRSIPFSLRLIVAAVCMSVCFTIDAQPKKSTIAKAIYTDVPYGYTQVGGTDLYYLQTESSLDIIGKFGDTYYSSTYSNGGYRLAMQVGNSNAAMVNCLDGTTIDGVTCKVSVAEQGELARICYTVVNENDTAVNVSLGTHADVMIGNNDGAPISRKVDSTTGNTYGLSLKDGNGAELCVLFGAGLNGVTAVSDFWFGHYSQNWDEYSMVGNYTEGSNYMEENGWYDSGMGWCWKNTGIAPGASVEFSYIIGVGDVKLEPSSNFEVTPDDPQGWNDLSRPHRLVLNGTYESPAGIDGSIEYAVEDSEEWTALTGILASGEEFTESISVMFDTTRPTHVIRFRITDVVGNTTLLAPIEYIDVSYVELEGIEDKTYTGDSIYQTNLTCGLSPDQYIITNYNNNVNSIEVSSTTASFYVEGVFPYTIGRKRYDFTINPADLVAAVEGVSLSEDIFTYNGSRILPEWSFANDGAVYLEEGKDYVVNYENNIYPGQGELSVSGIRNYSGVITCQFTIDKAVLSDSLYTVNMPDEDICFDEMAHPAEFTPHVEGIGEPLFTYLEHGTSTESADAPSAQGTYDIYLEITEGDYYYGSSKMNIGSFTIYQFDESEWLALEALHSQLVQNGWSAPWDMSLGAKAVGTFNGLTVKQGHVSGINLSACGITGEFPWSVFSFAQLEELDLSKNNLTGNIGNGMTVAMAAMPLQSGQLRKIDISDNGFSGNIGLFAMHIPSLECLLAAGNRLSDVYPAISSNVTVLDLGRQDMDNVLLFDLEENMSEAFLTSIPTLLLYDHATQSYQNKLDMLCAVSEDFDFSPGDSADDWAVRMSYDNGQITMPYISGQNAYYGESGDTLYVFNMAEADFPNVSRLRMKLSFADGDANFNGKTDVTDLQTIILRIFDNYKYLPFNFTAANMIKDEVINVQDVVGEVNLLLSLTETPAAVNSAAKANQDYGITTANIYCSGDKLVAYSSEPIAAFDIILRNATSLNVSDALAGMGMVYSMKETADGIHIVGYSLNGGNIPIGETTLASFTGRNVDVASAVLSDSQAERMSVSLAPQTTGINEVSTETAVVKLVDGKIIINSNNADAKWQITSPDGKLIACGVIPDNGAGSHAIDINERGILIVTVDINGTKITKKLTNN